MRIQKKLWSIVIIMIFTIGLFNSVQSFSQNGTQSLSYGRNTLYVGGEVNKEIITIINADVWEVTGKGRTFIWRDVEIFSRVGKPFEIWGLKRLDGDCIFFRERVEYLKAPFFIGLIFSQPPNFASANGFALGNVESE